MARPSSSPSQPLLKQQPPSSQQQQQQQNRLPTTATLLGEALEVCIHEILYLLQLYPADIFVPSRYLGVRYRAARHVELVDYIVEVLDVACPALIAGHAEGLSLRVVDVERQRRRQSSKPGDDNAKQEEEVEVVVESYVFEMKHNQLPSSSSSKHAWDSHQVTIFERSMRNFVLALLAKVSPSKRRKWSNRATFKLCLHTKKHTTQITTAAGSGDEEEEEEEEEVCPELEQAVQSGKWYQPHDSQQPQTHQGNNNKETNQENELEKTNRWLSRSIQQINLPTGVESGGGGGESKDAGGMTLSLFVEVPQDTQNE